MFGLFGGLAQTDINNDFDVYGDCVDIFQFIFSGAKAN